VEEKSRQIVQQAVALGVPDPVVRLFLTLYISG